MADYNERIAYINEMADAKSYSQNYVDFLKDCAEWVNDERWEQIREGLERDVDVSIYADPDYDERIAYINEMAEAKGYGQDYVDFLKDCAEWADYRQWKRIRGGLEEGFNVSIYADSKFNWMQMEQILEGLKSGVDVSIYADPKFDNWQMERILSGLQKGFDVSIYADPKFGDSEQMNEIYWGLVNGVDVSKYADQKFDNLQMRQIRFGLEDNLDISKYADPKYSANQMEEIRERLETEKN